MFDYKLWYSQNRDRLLAKMRFYRQQHTNQLKGYSQYYYSNNKEYFKKLYETNKAKRLDTNRYNHTRIKEQKPDIYIARDRKINARAILQRLARQLSYDYTVQALFNGWKYVIMRKVVKQIVVSFDWKIIK